MSLLPRLAELAHSGERAVLFTVVEGDGVGRKLLVVEGGERLGEGPEEAAVQADELIRGSRNRLVELEDGSKVEAAEMRSPRWREERSQ